MTALPPGTDLSKVPLAANPSGAPPNFTNPPSLGDAVEGVGISLIAISGVFILFRLYTNSKPPRSLGVDDGLCILAYAGGIGYWALNRKASRDGTSRHAWDVPVSIFTVPYIKIEVAIQMLVAPTLWSAKSAILALYIRIFGSVLWFRRVCISWIFFMSLVYGANIVISAVYCIPRKGESWNGEAVERCAKSTWSAVVIGVFSLISDILIFVLPFPLLLKLKLTKSKKVGLVAVFSAGLLLAVTSLISLVLRVQLFRGKDATWNGTRLAITTFSEIFGTVIVSCTPTLSGYWFNILAKSSFWTSLQSSFSKLSQSRKSKSTSSIRYQCNPASSSRIQRYEEIEDKKFAADVGQKGGVFLSTTESVAMVPMTPRSG